MGQEGVCVCMPVCWGVGVGGGGGVRSGLIRGVKVDALHSL